jgi:hypothetical protein
MVFEINGNEIFAKSGLNRPDDFVLFNALLKQGSDDVAAFVKSFLEGSKEAGISAEKILVYLSKIPDYTVMVPIVNKNAFEKWLKKMDAPEPVDEGKFRYIAIEENLNMAWNDDLLIISGASTREKIAEKFRKKDDGLLTVNSDFQQFVKKNADMRLWFQYTSLIDVYKNLMAFGMPLYRENAMDENDKLFSGLEEFSNISTHSYLDFENGKITGNTSFYPPEEMEKLKKKYPFFKDSFNSELFKDMPEQSYLAFNAFLDVKEYFKVIKQNIEKMLLNSSANEYEIEEKREELFKFFDSPELKSVVDALGGDILFSIHGFNSVIFTYPLASASFTVNGESDFKNILALIPENRYKQQDGYYSITPNNILIPIYFAYKDDRVFVSNDLETTKKFVSGSEGKTFADNPVSKNFTDKMMFYINLNWETYPENVKIFLRNIWGEPYVRFTSIMEIYENMYFSSDTDYNMEFCLQLKNNNVNSLKQILKNIDKTSSAWKN